MGDIDTPGIADIGDLSAIAMQPTMPTMLGGTAADLQNPSLAPNVNVGHASSGDVTPGMFPPTALGLWSALTGLRTINATA